MEGERDGVEGYPRTHVSGHLAAALEVDGSIGHARLLFSKSHDGKGANGSKNRPHDAHPVQCRVSGYYGPCNERVRVCQLKKCRQVKGLGHSRVTRERTSASIS